MYISFSLKVSFKTCKTKFTVFPCEIRKLSSPPSLLLSWVSFSPITLCSKIFYKNLEIIGPNSEIVVLLKNKISIALGIHQMLRYFLLETCLRFENRYLKKVNYISGNIFIRIKVLFVWI